jgi:O-antigen/teichoic acid export membrane protein
VSDAAPRAQRLAFFRQSGWMLLATAASGALMSFVHTPASRMGKADYAVFAAMVDLLYLLAIPAAGLQGAFARMAAAAVDEPRQAELRQAVRAVLVGITALWLGLAAAAWAGQAWLLELWRVPRPAALWFTLLTGLVLLWQPLFSGLLQGAQNFLWLGHATIAAGAGRLAAVALLVAVLGGGVAGGCAGLLAGALAALALSAAPAWPWCRGPGGGFRAGPWLRDLAPLTLGLGAGSVMLALDTLVVQAVYADDAKALYAAAGRVGRALVMFTIPMAYVLFPKAARSAATGEPTEALRLALGATLATGGAAALACTAFPELPLRVLFAGRPEFLAAAPLVTGFAWAMLPLAAAYTLIHNLLARGDHAAVPWLALVAGGYAATLVTLRGHLAALEPLAGFRLVLLVLGGFSLLLLAVAAGFSRAAARPARRPAG